MTSGVSNLVTFFRRDIKKASFCCRSASSPRPLKSTLRFAVMESIIRTLKGSSAIFAASGSSRSEIHKYDMNTWKQSCADSDFCIQIMKVHHDKDHRLLSSGSGLRPLPAWCSCVYALATTICTDIIGFQTMKPKTHQEQYWIFVPRLCFNKMLLDMCLVKSMAL